MSQPLALVVMAKYPTAGRVKTRLQPPLTAAQAALLHRVCLQTVCRRLQRLGPVVLCFDPPDAAEAFGRLCPEVRRLLPQSTGDLGHRLAAAAHALRADYDRLLFFGCDSPDVPDEHLRSMIELTLDVEATLAPTDDGGYWALGVRTSDDLAPVLAGIDWSSGRECRQTINQFRRHRIDIQTGPDWNDIDRPDDLARLLRRCRESTQVEQRRLYEQLQPFEPVLERDRVPA